MNDEEKQENYELAEMLIAQQNFAAALIAGAGATLLAAAAYGIAVATWAFSLGFAAAGIGIVVGLSMQFFGRGIATKFAVAAALYTIAGCVLGKVSLSVFAERSASYFSLVDLVYWFIAVFCAVFLAMRPLSRAQRLAIGLLRLRG